MIGLWKITPRQMRIVALGVTLGSCLSLSIFLFTGGAAEVAHRATATVQWLHDSYLTLVVEYRLRDQRKAEALGRLRGRQVARTDRERGILKLVWRGGPPEPSDAAFICFVRQRYGILIDYTFTCIVSAEEAGYALGYNEISEPEIDRRFGKRILDTEQKRFRADWAAGLRQGKRSDRDT